MYIMDVESFGDETHVMSESSVRRAWEDVTRDMNVSLRSSALLTKCSVCVGLKTKMLQVRFRLRQNR